MDRFFRISSSGSTLAQELRAGATTFLTMSYVLFVVPDILGKAIPIPNAHAQLLVTTALAAAVGSIVMGLVGRYPFATAPGLGLAAYFTYTVVLTQGVPWQTALGAVFVEGLVFLALSFGGIRQAIINGIPRNLKYATAVGIGMFLCLIGMKSGGLVEDHPGTLVTLGSLLDPDAAVSALGLVITSVLLVRRVPGAILYGIVATTLVAIVSHAAVFPGPEGKQVPFQGLGGPPLRAPIWPVDLVGAMDVSGAVGLGVLGIVFTFLFVEIFDTAGTLIGLAGRAGFLDEKGNLPRANEAFAADAVATTVGAALGASTTTAYIESAAGIEEGGRTGLTAVVTGVLFALSVFAWPLATAVPPAATAPVLILVGAMMMLHVGGMVWDDFSEVIPAFLTMVSMPFTFSIANGISLGIISWFLIKLLTGRAHQLTPMVVILALILIARYVWLGGA